MGQSTDAILFWGYCWDEERAAPWLGEDEAADADVDWEERYAKIRGVIPPSADYPHNNDKSEAAEVVRAAYSAFWGETREAVEASGCLVDSHCSGSCPMPYVAVAASRTKASRGHPQPIASLDVAPEWRGLLDAFCRDMRITPPEGQQPGWWLVSDWT